MFINRVSNVNQLPIVLFFLSLFMLRWVKRMYSKNWPLRYENDQMCMRKAYLLYYFETNQVTAVSCLRYSVGSTLNSSLKSLVKYFGLLNPTW